MSEFVQSDFWNKPQTIFLQQQDTLGYTQLLPKQLLDDMRSQLKQIQIKPGVITSSFLRDTAGLFKYNGKLSFYLWYLQLYEAPTESINMVCVK